MSSSSTKSTNNSSPRSNSCKPSRPCSSSGVTFNELALYYQPKLTVAVNTADKVLDRYENDLLNSLTEQNVSASLIKICGLVIAAIVVQ